MAVVSGWTSIFWSIPGRWRSATWRGAIGARSRPSRGFHAPVVRVVFDRWLNVAFGIRRSREMCAPETNEYTFLSVVQELGMSWKSAPNGRDVHSAKAKSTVPGGMPDISAKGSTTPLCHSAMLA